MFTCVGIVSGAPDLYQEITGLQTFYSNCDQVFFSSSLYVDSEIICSLNEQTFFSRVNSFRIPER